MGDEQQVFAENFDQKTDKKKKILSVKKRVEKQRVGHRIFFFFAHGDKTLQPVKKRVGVFFFYIYTQMKTRSEL